MDDEKIPHEHVKRIAQALGTSANAIYQALQRLKESEASPADRAKRAAQREAQHRQVKCQLERMRKMADDESGSD